MAGVFALILDTVHSKSNSGGNVWEYDDDVNPEVPVTDANMRDALGTCNSGAPFVELEAINGVDGITTFYVNPSVNFLLDGVPTDRLNTPPGFLITDFTIEASFFGAWSVDPILTLKQGPLLSRSLSPVIIAPPPAFCGSAEAKRTWTFATRGPLENFSVLNDPFGIHFEDRSGGSSFLHWNFLEVTGNYILEGWTANTSVTPETEISAGTILTITDIDSLDRLNDIDDCIGVDSPFTIQYTDLNGIIQNFTLPCSAIQSRTGNQILLYIGDWIPYGGRNFYLLVNVTSVEYTGSVSLALLNATLVEGSGVYTITKGKTDDTYYDRTNPAAPVTVDMKISNPYIKTGYF